MTDSGTQARSRPRRSGRGEMTAIIEALRTGQKACREREEELAGS